MESGLKEVHKITSSLFIIGGQLPSTSVDPTSGKYFTRVQLPWNAYSEVKDDFKVTGDSLVWELAKAGTEDRQLFQQLLPMATHAAIKEALVYGVSLEKAFLTAHAPDAAHVRLYEKYGFKSTTKNITSRSQHQLMVLSLADALHIERYKPRLYSEKVQTIADLSDRNLNDADVMRVLLQIRQLISSELNYDIPGLAADSPDARISIEDRSELFLPAAQGLLQAYGINENNLNKVADTLKNLNTVHRDEIASNDVSFLPEQLQPEGQDISFNISIQGLSLNQSQQDPYYQKKVLAGIYRWYKNQKSPFANFKDSQLLEHLKFTVFTNKDQMMQRLAAIGGQVKRTNFAKVKLSLHSSSIKFDDNSDAVWAVTFTAKQLDGFHPNDSDVGFGYWQRRKELRSTLVP